MKVLRIAGLVCAAGVLFAQTGPPRFVAEDVRPHGASSPHPLAPRSLVWIFGTDLARPPGCAAANTMDPATYKTELCGTRVLVGGLEAHLIFVSEKQINLVLPDHTWEDELVDFQVIRGGAASSPIPVRFGFDRPVLSLAQRAYAGMPVWIHVEKPWGTGWLRYPFQLEPWNFGPACFEVLFQNEAVGTIPFPQLNGCGISGSRTVALPGEVPSGYLNRIPLHALFKLDRAGNYQIRYTEYRFDPHTRDRVIHQRSDWTSFTLLPSTPEQRRNWLRDLAAAARQDPVELLTNFLPSLIASHDEAALRLLARYLDHPDQLVQRWSASALNYFGHSLPGRRPVPNWDGSRLAAPGVQ